MKTILTSFGIAKESDPDPEYDSPFRKMPPMRAINNILMPDFAALLLSDKVILDEQTFDALQEPQISSFAQTAETIKLLYSEGFIELANYAPILKANETLLKKMLENDFEVLEQWTLPLRESLTTWKAFLKNIKIRDENEYDILFGENPSALIHDTALPTLQGNIAIIDVFEATKKHKKAESHQLLKRVLSDYLSYVNANILLANNFEAGLHDWADFSPFYRKKFLYSGKEGVEIETHSSEIQKLFTISFPEFNIRNPRTLIKALQDKRISELRQLVQDAVDGKVSFDESFARHVFKDGLGVEREISKYRNIISYLTTPLDFIPWVGAIAPKIVEEISEHIVEQNMKKKYRWFYMLSDISSEYS